MLVLEQWTNSSLKVLFTSKGKMEQETGSRLDSALAALYILDQADEGR